MPALTPVFLQQLQQEMKSALDPRTGFLPEVTPLVDSPAPFEAISEAAHALASHYHGAGKDCRPWLDGLFAEMPAAWAPALCDASRPVAEALMTKVSLLCHAYRWRFMPTDPALYKITHIDLPPALDQLWTLAARQLGIPRVGMFYTMVANNWQLDGCAGGESYLLGEIRDGRIRLIDSWLLPPEDRELTAFITAALIIEAQGRRAADCVAQTYAAIVRDDPQEVAYRLVSCRDVLRDTLDAFNGLIRKDRMDITNFLKLVQPTMLWLLDHGDGPLEGASGPQACTMQLLDNFLGVPRDSALGDMILKARRYMLPRHRRLLEFTDAAQPFLRDYVARAGDSQLTELFNACVGTLSSWRKSHQKRGAMYLQGKPGERVEHYASTGLVVGVENDRVKIFEASMQAHIAETDARALEDPWAGRERTFDAVFRYLRPEQRALFRAAMKERPVAAGEILIASGQRRPGLMMLAEGEAIVQRSAGMRKVPIARLGAHDVFGEMSLLENEPAGAEVVACTAGVLAQLALDDFYALLHREPAIEAGLYLCLGKLLSARLRRINRILPDLLAAETPPARPPLSATDCLQPAPSPHAAKPWHRFAQANGFHRDFWPLWLLNHRELGADDAALAGTSLADLAALGGVEPNTPGLFLGLGPSALAAAPGSVLADPSYRVVEAWRATAAGALSTAHHENITRLAQGFGFLDLPACSHITFDLLLGFASDSEVVDLLNWCHHHLAAGSSLSGIFFTPAARACPVIGEFRIPTGTLRTEDQMTDLFTRSAWGEREVDFTQGIAGHLARFHCRKR